MTHEEMAGQLRAAGWRVQPPLTQDNCEHPQWMRIGQGVIGSDGSSRYDLHCRACGKQWHHETPPAPHWTPGLQLWS